MSFDRGLQPERTALAWRRTGLVGAGGAVALARVAALRGAAAIVVLCAIVIVVGAATLRHGTRELASRDEADPAGPTLPLAATGTVWVVVLLAVSGLVLVVAS